jgi:hypothetical protein
MQKENGKRPILPLPAEGIASKVMFEINYQSHRLTTESLHAIGKANNSLPNFLRGLQEEANDPNYAMALACGYWAIYQRSLEPSILRSLNGRGVFKIEDQTLLEYSEDLANLPTEARYQEFQKLIRKDMRKSPEIVTFWQEVMSEEKSQDNLTILFYLAFVLNRQNNKNARLNSKHI